GRRCPGPVLRGSFGAVFAPGEPDQEGVEDGQRGQADGEVDGGDPVELVADEGQQQHDQPRVGPQLVFQHQRHQDYLGDAVAEQVDGAEQGGAVAQVGGGVQQVAGDQVVRVLAELVRGQHPDQVVDRGRAHHQQQDPAGDLQAPV